MVAGVVRIPKLYQAQGFYGTLNNSHLLKQSEAILIKKKKFYTNERELVPNELSKTHGRKKHYQSRTTPNQSVMLCWIKSWLHRNTPCCGCEVSISVLHTAMVSKHERGRKALQMLPMQMALQYWIRRKLSTPNSLGIDTSPFQGSNDPNTGTLDIKS